MLHIPTADLMLFKYNALKMIYDFILHDGESFYKTCFLCSDFGFH
jgi:hypothetical protein